MKKTKFRPKPGQVDFTNARWAPVMNCVVKYRNKILLVQRSDDLKFYPGYWNGISGFLDDQQSLEEKVRDEIREELGMPKTKIGKVILCGIFHQDAPAYKKTWIVHAMLTEVRTNKVKLDWEAKTHRWVSPKEALGLNLLPGFDEVLKRVFSSLRK